MGIIFLNDSFFYGILTTKDILNIFNIEKNLYNESIKNYINIQPFIFDKPDELIKNKIKEINKYGLIPVLDNNKYIGIIDNSKILKYL